MVEVVVWVRERGKGRGKEEEKRGEVELVLHEGWNRQEECIGGELHVESEEKLEGKYLYRRAAQHTVKGKLFWRT